MLDGVTHTNDNIQKILQWTDISTNVARSFFSFLYSGKLNLDLETFEEWNEAKILGEIYDFKLWRCYVESLRDEFDQTKT